MKIFLKKHLGLIICLLCLIAFPSGLGVQARLNMRIIVTGLAVDFDGENYTVTAQYVKTTQGGEGTGGAEVAFIDETDKTTKSAIAKLIYKSGKSAAFSHINFVILGKELAEEKAVECLDYFVRNKIIDSSAMVLISSNKAGDDIKKTKDLELSVASSMQKVFVYKQMESDAVMTTVIEFLKWSKTESGAVAVSEILFDSKDETKKSAESEEGGTSGESQDNSSSMGEQKNETFFKPKAPIVCFKNGKFALKLESENEIDGFLMLRAQSTRADVLVENLLPERLKNAKVGIKIKAKKEHFSVRYENEIPTLDVKVRITNAEIIEIAGQTLIQEFSNEEFDAIKKGIEEEIKKKVSVMFETTKSAKVDVLGAYDRAIKFNFKQTKRYYQDVDEFTKKLKLNVDVKVERLEY